MTRRGWLLCGIFVLGAVGFVLWNGQHSPSKSPVGSDCKAIMFEARHFSECLAVPGKHSIETRITGNNGIIYRGFAALAAEGGSEGIAFAINAGMYDTGSRPIGYYVEGRKQLYPLNTRSAEGNFYLKPNGVFFGESTGDWRVTTSDDFAATVTKRPSFGTQSGPMLLTDGAFHPQIAENGSSLKLRNAVGIDEQGRAHFVISDEPVSFGMLARLMRDHAKTHDALFLDGEVSALWIPANGRMDGRYPLGPLIVVRSVSKGARQ